MNSIVILALILCVPVGGVIGWMIAKATRDTSTKQILLCGLPAALLAMLLTVGISYGGISLLLEDTEIISGEVISKERKHDTYLRSYSCNCRTNSKGNRTCSTCHERRYTVKWKVDTNVGNHTIKSLDSTWKSVYASSDPQFYTTAKIGDPAAADHSYKNYMKGVPREYRYNDNLGSPPELLAKIPVYPTIHDFYMVNRVFVIDNAIPGAMHVKLNAQIAIALKKLGMSKEVNILVVAAPANESNLYAVREKWDGGKKNDVIVVLNMDGDQIESAPVMTWAKNELFKEHLSQAIMEAQNLDTIIDVITKIVSAEYERPRMRDLGYLQVYIQPPTWSFVLIFVMLIVAPIVTFFVVNHKPKLNRRYYR